MEGQPEGTSLTSPLLHRKTWYPVAPSMTFSKGDTHIPFILWPTYYTGSAEKFTWFLIPAYKDNMLLSMKYTVVITINTVVIEDTCTLQSPARYLILIWTSGGLFWYDICCSKHFYIVLLHCFQYLETSHKSKFISSKLRLRMCGWCHSRIPKLLSAVFYFIKYNA